MTRPSAQARTAIALARSGDIVGALQAGEQALQEAPNDAGLRTFVGVLCSRTGDAARAAKHLDRAHKASPDDPLIALELARALVRTGDAAQSSEVFMRVLALEPDQPEALLGLAVSYERTNNLDALDALLADAPPLPGLTLIRARALRRRGRFADALALAETMPNSDEDALHAREIGENADRLGDSARAFAAFSRMNAIDRAANPDAVRRAAGLNATLDRYSALTTTDWYREWRPLTERNGARPAPVFLFGFPRSGTTLLDTMLMGHAEIAVLEEEATLQPVADAIGDPARIGALDDAEVDALRTLYWRGVDKALPQAANDRLIVDKFPLGLVGTAIAHRLFSDAYFIFAERDPRDAVLSCFTTRFAMNAAMAAFLSLDDAARLYDRALSYWMQCQAVFDLHVLPIRYERLIDDPEGELRPLLSALGLGWDARILAHPSTARNRGFIRTPSYAQVTEPIYTRAAGRWLRYRSQMAPVLPLLDQWAARLGYI